MTQSFSYYARAISFAFALFFSGLTFGANQEWVFNIVQSNSDQFNISADPSAASLGYIVSDNKLYEYYDTQNKLNAQVQIQQQGAVSVAVIQDIYGSTLGTIKEQSYIFYPTFDILLPDGTLVATVSSNLWWTKTEITDPKSGAVIATATRPYDRSNFNWHLEISNMHLFQEKEIDVRVLFFLFAILSGA